MNINIPRDPETAEELVAHLRKLRAKRETQKKESRPGKRQASVSSADRRRISAKTAGHCHICGGKVGRSYLAGGSCTVS
jgi:hypothetical protein